MSRPLTRLECLAFWPFVLLFYAVFGTLAWLCQRLPPKDAA